MFSQTKGRGANEKEAGQAPREPIGVREQSGKLSGLTASQRRTILREAQSLGISPSEYLTMILTLSKTIRHSLAVTNSFDPKAILEWANNPLLTSLLSGLLGSVTKSSEAASTNSENASNVTSGSASSKAQFPPQAVPRTPNGTLPPLAHGGEPQLREPAKPSQQPNQPPYNPWGGWM